MRKQSAKGQIRISLIRTIEKMGYPTEFGEVIANSLGTEKQMSRMVSWLIQFKPKSAEQIADEMLAVKEEFQKYKEKKIAEYYNSKYNEMLNSGPLDDDTSVPIGCFMLGEIVTVNVDRPLGSIDKDMYYSLNCGNVEGFYTENGELIDAVVLGTEEPLETFQGKVKAVITPQDENKEIWVVIAPGYITTKDEIVQMVKPLLPFESFMIVM